MSRAVLEAPPTAAIEAEGVDARRPVLVCGVGRSGTSLLQSMLNAHPALALPPETHFFRRYVARRGLRKSLEVAGAPTFAERLAGDDDFQRAGISAEELLRPFEGRRLDLAAAYARLLATWAARDGKARVGDKDPRNLDFLPELHGVFPEAFVVHIVRDPRAVVESRTRAAWSKNRPWWAHALLAQDQLRRGRRVGEELFGDRYLELRYEALLADPEGELGRVCRHVDLPYDPAMLDFGGSARRLVGEREMSWKKETLGPLLPGNAEKWRERLDPRQVAFVEAVCTEAFDALGYERTAGRGHAGHGLLRLGVRGANAWRRRRDTR